LELTATYADSIIINLINDETVNEKAFLL